MDGLIWAVIAFVVICTLSAQGLLGNVIGAILVIVAGIGVCIFIGKLLKKKRERTPAINRVNKDRRTNIELLVNDIIRKNNLLLKGQSAKLIKKIELRFSFYQAD